MKQCTLCIAKKENKILLAMKKRGFGVGKWNGYGGKFNPEADKTILDTAVRETKEEVGIEAKELKQMGLFHFRFPHRPEWDQDVHLFIFEKWIGNPVESEEMAPKWFSFSEIPYEKMWDDDKIWLPRVLRGEKIEADFVFAEGGKIENYEIKSTEI